MAFSSRNGVATRAVALDLMLRTFMNSADFQPYNPRVWESVAKLVPGTTPQQCIRRWEELRATTKTPPRDLSTLSAKGRPISAQERQLMNRQNSNALHTQGTQATYSTASTPSHTKLFQPQESAVSSHVGNSGSSGGDSGGGGGGGVVGELPPLYSYESLSRPCSSRSSSRLSTNNGYRLQSGKFTASFCQTHLSSANDTQDRTRREISQEVVKGTNIERGGDLDKKKEAEQEQAVHSPIPKENSCLDIRSPSSSVSAVSSTSAGDYESILIPPTPAPQDIERSTSEPLMVIHVHDEAKRINKDFVCTRDVLVREMQYFSSYLSSPESHQWEEVDISVHCDVAVFEWLMRYTKQGMMEGPSGEKLNQPLSPPNLEPGNVVAVLISSEFLKMQNLVKECLAYCHAHMTEIVASACNMNCISSPLLARLAQLYSPLELEDIVDPKDKIKSKLYQQMLQKMFQASYTHQQCPANASTLFRCQHCGRVMTCEESAVLQCLPHRLAVHKNGQLVYKHEKDQHWDVGQYLKSLKPVGTSWRTLYWRVWGVINWLSCDTCGQGFQCSSLLSCPYHPETTKLSHGGVGKMYTLTYACCGQPETSFSPMTLRQSGCTYREHIVAIPDTSASSGSLQKQQQTVYHILLRMKDLLCPSSMPAKTHTTAALSLPGQPEVYLLKNEQRERRHHCTEPPKPKKPPSNHSMPVTAIKELRPSSAKKESHPSLSRTVPAVSSHKQMRRAHQHHQVMDEDGEDSDSESDSSPSEVEEDEADTVQHVHIHHQRKKKSRKTRPQRIKTADRILTPEAAALLPPHNWLWDSSKSNRLNQDMQRYSDERRLDQLSDQLRCTPPLSGSEPATSKSTHSTQNGYAGGIYCRIEAQFRANVTTLHKTSANSYRTTRKKT